MYAPCKGAGRAGIHSLPGRLGRRRARRLGVILIAAGLVTGFLEEGQVLSTGLLTGTGLAVSWYGNLEQQK